ncbi:MAG: glycosyltransferase family 1 protein [Proteobacteria bacterium]|nr:MAG: glycosyltransferase family 1 protein [Pseudomonadota bacterium]
MPLRPRRTSLPCPAQARRRTRHDRGGESAGDTWKPGRRLNAPSRRVPGRRHNALTTDRQNRILFVITRANVGGAQKHVAWLIESVRHRFDILVVTGETGFLTARLDELGVQYEVLDSLRREIAPLRDLRACAALRRIIKRFSPDLIHLHSFKASMLGRVAAIGLPSRVIVTAHGWSFSDQNPRSRKIIGLVVERSLARLTDRVVVVCRRDRDTALSRRILSADRLELIHNGVPERGGAPARAQGPGRGARVINVGRLCDQKNQLDLVRLFNALPQSTRLTLVGDGPHHDEIQREILDRGLESRVRLDTDNTEPDNRLAAADIYATCARWEGLPLAVIEALRAGLPIVATDVGGTEELVQSGVNGFLVPAGETRAFAEALERLIADPDLRTRMGSQSRRLYLKRFQLETFITRTLALYQAVLSNETDSTPGAFPDRESSPRERNQS